MHHVAVEYADHKFHSSEIHAAPYEQRPPQEDSCHLKNTKEEEKITKKLILKS